MELGLDEIFDRAAVVIEWVDLFPAAVPAGSPDGHHHAVGGRRASAAVGGERGTGSAADSCGGPSRLTLSRKRERG